MQASPGGFDVDKELAAINERVTMMAGVGGNSASSFFGIDG